MMTSLLAWRYHMTSVVIVPSLKAIVDYENLGGLGVVQPPVDPPRM